MINKLSTYTLFALIGYWIVYTLGFNYGYKTIETEINPVVTDFTVSEIYRDDTSLYISGTMDKKRKDCVYQALTVYDIAVNPRRLLDLKTIDTPNMVQNRDTGLQAWGVWRITPNTKNIELTVTHSCNTGTVITTLYRGAI